MNTVSHLARILPGYAIGSLFVRRVERGAVARLAGMLLGWQERANQRHALMQMDDRALADLGLSRADVAAETRKSFWQA